MKKMIVCIVFFLCIGIVSGILIQKFYPVGRILASLSLPIPNEIMDESKLREARARKNAAIDRSQYSRIIHIYGDSIARGWGFGVFEDPSPLNRVHDIANILIADNGFAPKELYIRYAWSQDIEQMRTELASGMIKSGDTIVFEDAGPHEDNVEVRRQRFLSMKEVIKLSGRDVQLILTTMFDYWPTPPYYNSEYDAVIGQSGLTMNDVVRSLAADGSCQLLDWNSQMDLAMIEFQKFGASPMHRDMVHPNIFGNFLLAVSLLKHLDIPITNYHTIRKEFRNLPSDYYKRLQYAKPLSIKHLDEVLDVVIKIASHGKTNMPNKANW